MGNKKLVILDVRNFEGKALVYERPEKKLSFMEKPKDTKDLFTVGVVTKGMVAGKTVEYWLTKIAKRKSKSKKEA